MQSTIKFSYTETTVPHGCRKPRNVIKGDGIVKVRIREVSAAQAPVAIRSVMPEHSRFPGLEVEYRYFGGNLWTRLNLSHGAMVDTYFVGGLDASHAALPDELDMRTDSYGFQFEHKFGLMYEPSGSKDVIAKALRGMAASHILIDGIAYRLAPEPRYVVMTFGLSRNHGGTSLSVDDHFNSNLRRDAYFSLLELEAGLARATEVAQNRGDTNSLPIKPGGPCFEVLIPEAIRVNRKRKASRAT